MNVSGQQHAEAIGDDLAKRCGRGDDIYGSGVSKACYAARGGDARAPGTTEAWWLLPLLVRINCALAARSPAGGAARPELNKKSCPEHIARLMEAVSKLWSGYMCMLME